MMKFTFSGFKIHVFSVLLFLLWCSGINSQTTTFNYTGAVQTFTAPSTGSYSFEAWGASGWTGSSAGGKGGYATGTYNLTAG
ncbi:MAG: glycine-rich protein, partial [Flavobacteriales bacterium]